MINVLGYCTDLALGQFRSLYSGGGFAVSQSNGSAVLKTTSDKNISRQAVDYEADDRRWSAAMVRAQAGDKAEYQQLLAELSKVIHRYLHSRFGHQDFIEDCVQEILLAIHHARHTYQADRLFRPWMFAIVRNKAIDMLRKRKSYEKMVALQTDEVVVAEGQATPDFSHDLEQTLTQGRLLEALAPAFKDAIELTKLAGFSNAEAAKALGITETAVKVRVHRGIAKLRSMMEAEAYE